jgi:cell division protein FtsB
MFLMGRSSAILRFVLFCIFFSVGAGAIALSILAEEIETYFANRRTYAQTMEMNEKIEKLIAEYEAQIEEIEKNPEILKKLERITFGAVEGEEGSEHPRAAVEQLAAARAALLEEMEGKKEEKMIDKWVGRIVEPKARMRLFFAGAGLVLITFMFFGTVREMQ